MAVSTPCISRGTQRTSYPNPPSPSLSLSLSPSLPQSNLGSAAAVHHQDRPSPSNHYPLLKLKPHPNLKISRHSPGSSNSAAALPHSSNLGWICTSKASCTPLTHLSHFSCRVPCRPQEAHGPVYLLEPSIAGCLAAQHVVWQIWQVQMNSKSIYCGDSRTSTI